jgi:ubiquinone/menaquinone biosynthesis C-methylase UbiE
MDIDQRLQLEQEWHDSEDFARDDSSLIVGVYASPVFKEAEAYHVAALGDVHGRHVLDYGCGTGGTATQLLAQGAQVTGFDISHARLMEARQRVAGEPGDAATGLLQCAAEMLPFSDGAFDAVLGKQILHHLDLKIAIPEIARVLRPGGRAVFLEPLIHNPILEGYRRLTLHLRSPTERALSMTDIAIIGSHFRGYRHQEFILLAILPAAGGGRAGPRTRRAGRLAAATAGGRPQVAGRLAGPGPHLLGDGDYFGAVIRAGCW